ncbi:putative RNA methyltransferase [Usnea florida]
MNALIWSYKRKRGSDQPAESEVDTSKPTAVFEAKEGRKYTLSIALPGSIIANAQTPELQTLLAGQIARALAVFCVDEVVVFDDGSVMQDAETQTASPSTLENGGEKDSYTGYTDPNYFLAHILSYLETPPSLRKDLFPLHPDLRLAGSLPSLDMPHHPRRHEWCQYREGVTKPELPHKRERKTRRTPPGHTCVWTGLDLRVFVSGVIAPETRVTVKFKDKERSEEIPGNELLAEAVAPSAPREEAGYYWGYSVRSASCLSAVLTECPFDGGYDLTIGTSERGVPVSTLDSARKSTRQPIPEFAHMMVVFGGVAGLEVAVKSDKELEGLGVKGPEALFDHWVNLCPGQGSRTIRTEEAVWLGLMGLRNVVLRKGKL